MDALAEVLAVARVRGTVAATVAASGPWGLALDSVPGAAFHAITDGTAWLHCSGHPDVLLMPGDVVLLPSGLAHTLASDRQATCEPFDHVAAEQTLQSGEELRIGAGISQTRILCASYRQDPVVSLPLLTLLPEMLHLPSTQATPALQATLQLLAAELRDRGLGGSAVLNHIVDILLVQLVRAWLAISPGRTQSASWLEALADPIVGPALTAIHAQPDREWTVTRLAGQLGVSRATLARRFAERVGATPAGYLTNWRMDLAARRLVDTDDAVAVIGRSVGYSSEYAFNRAFARNRGVPPGRYRHKTRELSRESPEQSA